MSTTNQSPTSTPAAPRGHRSDCMCPICKKVRAHREEPQVPIALADEEPEAEAPPAPGSTCEICGKITLAGATRCIEHEPVDEPPWLSDPAHDAHLVAEEQAAIAAGEDMAEDGDDPPIGFAVDIAGRVEDRPAQTTIVLGHCLPGTICFAQERRFRVVGPARNGRVRVAYLQEDGGEVTSKHGLPGTTEVAVLPPLPEVMATMVEPAEPATSAPTAPSTATDAAPNALPQDCSEAATVATTAPPEASNAALQGSTTTAATAAPKLSKLTVPELQARLLEVLGRPCSSCDVGYLRWRLHQAEKGRIHVGPRQPRRQRLAGSEGGAVPVAQVFKVLPLRLESTLVASLDEAWARLGLKSRTALIKLALQAYLAGAGETEVAALFC